MNSYVFYVDYQLSSKFLHMKSSFQKIFVFVLQYVFYINDVLGSRVNVFLTISIRKLNPLIISIYISLRLENVWAIRLPILDRQYMYIIWAINRTITIIRVYVFLELYYLFSDDCLKNIIKCGHLYLVSDVCLDLYYLV